METKPKSRFARLMLATLAGTLALGGTVATMARADSHFDDSATVQALGAAKLTLADAIRTAAAAGQGMVTSAEFEIKDGKPVFDVTTQNGSAEIDHLIDSASGAMLASTPDVEDADGDQGTDEASELTALQGAKVSLLQAVTAAEGQGGKALSAEYAKNDGALAIDVEMADASGKTVELKVDAMTGQVMAADSDAGDEDGENGENGEEQEG
ncbi:MAG: PepSY domain-containing protein [Gemmobacter sp.]